MRDRRSDDGIRVMAPWIRNPWVATGLTGRRYVGTGACLAASVHVGRLLGYGGGVGVSSQTLALGLGFAVAVPFGNVLGDKVRERLPARTARPLELSTAAVMAGLAVVGLR